MTAIEFSPPIHQAKDPSVGQVDRLSNLFPGVRVYPKNYDRSPYPRPESGCCFRMGFCNLLIQIFDIVNNLVVDLPLPIFFSEDHVTGNPVVTKTRPADFLCGKGEGNNHFILICLRILTPETL